MSGTVIGDCLTVGFVISGFVTVGFCSVNLK